MGRLIDDEKTRVLIARLNRLIVKNGQRPTRVMIDITSTGHVQLFEVVVMDRDGTTVPHSDG